MMDTGEKHSNTTIRYNIIDMHNHYYMVLFFCNYEFDAEKLEQALSSLIDMIFSIRWIQFLP